LRIGLVVPHIFMQDAILPKVIFSPGEQALLLADGLVAAGHQVKLFTPGPVTTTAQNIVTDNRLFDAELAGRNDTPIDLLKKHPLTFITLARQLQAELIAKAYQAANNGELDIVHIYTNEEELAMTFAQFCNKPVVFTHHDPFNFLVIYKSIMPKYKHLNWLSMSIAQRQGMPEDTNWLANIYHGLPIDRYSFYPKSSNEAYIVFIGRIIEAKGLHLAIDALKHYNSQISGRPKLKLKIAGKHYSGSGKDNYWQNQIVPRLDDPNIEYLGFVNKLSDKQQLLGNATAVIVPSLFDEPFGIVCIESLACGTPVIGLDSGALPEIIEHGLTGAMVHKSDDEVQISQKLSEAITTASGLSRQSCRDQFESRFTLETMVNQHLSAYGQLGTPK
jgi:glycosyltransferase involved in cell wall biosynthesis